VAKALIAELSPLYPAKTWPMNRELCQTLIALGAPDAVEKTVKLLNESKVQEEQVGYVLYLRTATVGWTPELRKEYFTWWTKDRAGLSHAGDTVKWFDEAGRPYADGASFPKFIGNFHSHAAATLTPQETASLADVLKAYTPPGAKAPAKPAKEHKFVKQWTMAELEPLVKELKGRSYNNGKEAFTAAQCAACHVFGKEGGASGPDLTAVSSRFQRRDILEAIIEPSKVISEQYQNIDVRTKDGDVYSGRIVEDKPNHLVVVQDPRKPDVKVTVKKADIKNTAPSKVSPMPQGLVDILTRDEILDMLAYIESGGNKSHPAFSK
jgi:putative heme-binding domain-containing protein